MLFWPFYEPFLELLRQHGWKALFLDGTAASLFEMPPVVETFRMILQRRLPTKSVVDIVYPLVLGVGVVMSAFLGFHLKYILTARTTLEHRVALERLGVTLLSRKRLGSGDATTPSSSSTVAVNPFDQGWRKNLAQVFGSNLLLVFLPIPVTPPAPYVPGRETAPSPATKKRN